jgi:hypothetical protein
MPAPYGEAFPNSEQFVITDVLFSPNDIPVLLLVMEKPRILMFWTFWLTLMPRAFRPPSMMVEAIYEGSLDEYSKLTITILFTEIFTFSIYLPGYTRIESPGDDAVTAV